MSLPRYLQNIKSAGVYRFTFDKSQITEEEKQTLRLVVGYSEKGPFNTPVYIETADDFISIFGSPSRRMERKGIFFNRLGIQALDAGPILALNLKPFNVDTDNPEEAAIYAFNATDLGDGVTGHDVYSAIVATTTSLSRGNAVTSIYDTNRFWKVDPERIHDIKMGSGSEENNDDYIRIVQTSSFDDSCTIFIRPCVPEGYDIKISDWYSSETSYDMPPYLEPLKDHYLNEFWAEVYVFKGNLAKEGLFDYTGTLGDYRPFIFNYDEDTGYLTSITVQENDAQTTYDVDSDYFKEVLYSNGLIESTDSTTLTDGTALTEIISDYESQISWQPFCIVDGDNVYSNPNYKDLYGQPADALEAMANVSTSNFLGAYQGILFPGFQDAYGSYISLDIAFNSDYEIHKMLMHMDEELLDEAYDADVNSNEVYDDDETSPTTHDSTTYSSVAALIHSLTSAVCSVSDGDGSSYTDYTQIDWEPEGKAIYGKYMYGYTYNSIAKSDKGQTLVNKIYGVMSYKGIYEALTNNVDSDYHYLIDTFQGYPGKAMKSQFANLCRDKGNALAIVNFPPIRDIIKYCGYNSYLGGFDMSNITKATSNISMPYESQGASFIAFYTQLSYSDSGTKFNIPSAALVSNLFMTKNADRQMYDIVAGPKYGRITDGNVIGPDYNYARADLDVLEPLGVNAIIYQPRYGIYINGNQTAKQKPKSALSKVHVRELVIFAQDEIETMLRGYHFDLNTSTLRDNIKAKAEVILGLIKANGGIYDYHIICDDTNNTAEVIDNDMLIIDYDIEPAKGAEKMVQRTTLRKTGEIATLYPSES